MRQGDSGQRTWEERYRGAETVNRTLRMQLARAQQNIQMMQREIDELRRKYGGAADE